MFHGTKSLYGIRQSRIRSSILAQNANLYADSTVRIYGVSELQIVVARRRNLIAFSRCRERKDILSSNECKRGGRGVQTVEHIDI